MITLLVDANLDGHANLIEMRFGSDPWREFRDHLGFRFLYLEQAGLDRPTRDDVVWRFCQQNGYYLLTANRNRSAEHSLEATLRREGKADSLAAFTLADSDRIFQSAAYLDEVVESLVTYLLDEGNLRGVGRLYLP